MKLNIVVLTRGETSANLVLYRNCEGSNAAHIITRCCMAMN